MMDVPAFIGLKKATDHMAIVLDSYQRHFNEPLVPAKGDFNTVLEALWEADFALLSHGTESDPVFNFGNITALKLFEMEFKDFTCLPSRKSAEEITQQERKRLLEEVSKNGCIRNYAGIRISSSGKRFYIENARVWNLIDEGGRYYGQAAMFRSWKNMEQP